MSSVTVSREARIVFLTAGGRASDERLQAVLNEGPVNWLRLNQLSTAQKAAASLSRALDRIGFKSLPDEIAASLRRQRMVSEFHMLHLRERLQQTMRAFAADRIPVMLIKGSAMATSVYDDFAERPMADIDLLIRREDAQRALAALRKADWVSPNNKTYETFFAQHHHLEPLMDGRGSRHRIELHITPFRPPNPFELAESDLWAQAKPVRGDYPGVCVPLPAHMFVYAAIHMAWSHMMTRGAWRTMRDLHALAALGVTLADVAVIAKRWKASSACYWSIRLSQLLSHGPAFTEGLEIFAMPHSKRMSDMLERHLLSELVPGERNACPSEKISEFLWRSAMKPKWSGHGSAMPGTEDDLWPTVPDTSEPPRPVLLREAAGRWTRFLRGLTNA